MLKLFFILTIFFAIIEPIGQGKAYEDAQEKRVNIWPFIFYSKNKITNSTRLEILGPFYQKYTSSYENGTSFRPILSLVSTPQEKKAFFISPLGVYKSDNESSSFKLIPLINRTWYKDRDESKDLEDFFVIFPFFVGKTLDNESYWGIFPLYGRFKERFGAKEINFILWPLYTKTEYDEYISYNVLWPFIRILKQKSSTEKSNKEEDTYQGFKIWPFYGSFVEGPVKRKFVLWPFYIRESFLSQEEFSNKTFIFPFYISEDTNAYKKEIILWPFFQKIKAHDESYYQLDAPWPFYREIRGSNIRGTKIWPFYGYVKKEDSFDFFIFWPFYLYKYTYLSHKNLIYTEKEHRVLVLSKFKEIVENSNNSSEILLWPFFYFYKVCSNSSNQTTSKVWYFPALLPIFDEGLERNYSSFLKLIEYYNKEDYTFLKILWGLYRYEKYKNNTIQEIGFLVRIINGQATSYVEFFEGLLGIGKIDNVLIFKLFYLTVKKHDKNYLRHTKEDKIYENSRLSRNF